MQEKIESIIEKLSKKYRINSFGRKSSPFETLIATILSQRTRDENTDIASRNLLSKFRTPYELMKAEVREIEKLIKPAGFYRNKARKIKEICSILVEKYGGNVPSDMEELLSLPGVGRKTANCVLVYGFGIPAIPVDTHVHRISNRLGLIAAKNPEETERKLCSIVPKNLWLPLNELFVKFGKDICRPVNPRCMDCELECPKATQTI